MSLTNFPFGVSSFGMPVVQSGAPMIPATFGKYFFVDSNTGVDANGRGTAPSSPFATLAYAITKATAFKGDVIIVNGRHAEAISTATYLNLSKGMVTVVGLGSGDSRPTFTLGTVIGSTVTISGSDVVIDNCIFNLVGLDAITTGFTITGSGVVMRNCKILTNDNASSVGIVFSLGANRIQIDRCAILGTGTDTGTSAVFVSSAAIDRLVVSNCDIRVNASVAIFSSTSTNHITNLLIANNYLRQSNGTAKNIFNLTTASTGLIVANICNGTTWSTAADVLSNSSSVNLRWFQNFGFDDGAGAVSGVLVPAVGTIA